jgi:hypothetical protein
MKSWKKRECAANVDLYDDHADGIILCAPFNSCSCYSNQRDHKSNKINRIHQSFFRCHPPRMISSRCLAPSFTRAYNTPNSSFKGVGHLQLDEIFSSFLCYS